MKDVIYFIILPITVIIQLVYMLFPMLKKDTIHFLYYDKVQLTLKVNYFLFPVAAFLSVPIIILVLVMIVLAKLINIIGYVWQGLLNQSRKLLRKITKR